jgi:hypothetical protein
MSRNIYGSIVLTALSALFFYCGGTPALSAMGFMFGVIAVIAWYVVFEEYDEKCVAKKKAACKEVFMKKTKNGNYSLLVIDCTGTLAEITITEEAYNQLIAVCDQK